ncbi:hypothetical protein FA95DRAFT_242352 [Auriscalpium vulgare]|uniref:Uncharacterized protein n=1 Tax=Auriscalpium vulgare TaxID=40419 RepID=A0ACB8S6A4_9AGAM|nr:hypothetical protein FA95DRAFT_242352 [Auriscalpium vulgare]
MANSSSAFTLISRAFSKASCLMNATWTVAAISTGRGDRTRSHHLFHLGQDLVIVEGSESHGASECTGCRGIDCEEFARRAPVRPRAAQWCRIQSPSSSHTSRSPWLRDVIPVSQPNSLPLCRDQQLGALATGRAHLVSTALGRASRRALPAYILAFYSLHQIRASAAMPAPGVPRLAGRRAQSRYLRLPHRVGARP